MQLRNVWSTALVPSRRLQPPILPPWNFWYLVFVYMRPCMWLLFQVSCISLCDFSCLGVLHMSSPPTTLLLHPVQSSMSYFLYFLGIALPLSAFGNHQCPVPSPEYIGKLLLFGCPVLYVCLGIVVWLLSGETTALGLHTVSCTLDLY